jgi:hypothetical protein
MNLHSDDKASVERPASTVEAAIDRCYLDCLIGRVLPPEDHLGILFDSLDQTARPDPEEGAATAEMGPH